MLAATAQATITCSDPKLSKPVAHDATYHFKATVTCDLVGETINLKALKDAFLADIVKKGSQFKVHEQKDYNQNGLTGYTLDATQSYDSPNGAMAVRANVIIADDQAKNFYYELRSKSIDAEGDAKYDKTILNITTLQVEANKGVLKLTKEIDVEEPWYAPDSMFFDKVESQLTESIRKAALVNAKKICGQDVDALRK